MKTAGGGDCEEGPVGLGTAPRKAADRDGEGVAVKWWELEAKAETMKHK